MNSWKGSGRLVEDPRIKNTAKGTVVAEIRVAVSDERKQEETLFIDIVIFGARAKAMELCQKGAVVWVDGRLKLESWEKDGQKRSKLIVVAEEISIPICCLERQMPGAAPATDSEQSPF